MIKFLNIYKPSTFFSLIETTYSAAAQRHGLDFFTSDHHSHHISFLISKTRPKDGYSAQLTVKFVVHDDLKKSVDGFDIAKEIMKKT